MLTSPQRILIFHLDCAVLVFLGYGQWERTVYQAEEEFIRGSHCRWKAELLVEQVRMKGLRWRES